MQMIVLGVDGSETAHRAAAVALDLAGATGAGVHFVTAYSSRPPLRVETGSGDVMVVGSLEQAEELLAELVAEYRSRGVSLTTAAVEAKPADAICSEAERLGADLIVVGNRRLQGVTRVLGAVASRILSHAPCDVYVVKTN